MTSIPVELRDSGVVKEGRLEQPVVFVIVSVVSGVQVKPRGQPGIEAIMEEILRTGFVVFPRVKSTPIVVFEVS